MKFLIVGLGNIGDEYANTRHNIGFIVADAFVQSMKGSFEPGRLASVSKVTLKGRIFVVIKPSTYMNLSGKAVKYWMDKEKIPLENLLVVTDDLDLEPGALRLKPRGSGGSHNGMNHIIETFGFSEFPRLRIGIGSDFARGFQVDYVLGRWTKNEEKVMLNRIPLAVDTIKSFVLQGIDRTMNEYNNK